ncbi:transglutaminase family protein [Methylobrevis pamukkalensis]|uniref:Transglutaminase-like superfamily protein n=1 Tax=Methylobrevis pamukkalensis TaxID=1439726 RepID=A0A1E3H302_9HYPH|nr:transglutaminase family protein [Methylobrevis pamukkalensis]ODN70664.1 Transglutaminase-like superfamily protein [Methylobrevis pamukkalensis]
MRLKVFHEITTTFTKPASYVIQKLRISPRTQGGQYVRDWRIDIDHDCRLEKASDSFVNHTHTFTIEGPVDSVTVTATGDIDVDDTSGVVERGPKQLPLGLYLRTTPLTEPDAAIRALAEEMRGEGASPLDHCHALMAVLGERIADAEASVNPADVGPAAKVLAAGKGSSIDVAHVFITAARILGLPSRLVSGYMYDPDHPERGNRAWSECYVEDLGWVGFDPLFDRCPTDSYIRIACGLDWLGACPLRGSSTGLGDSHTTSRVRVSPAR